MKIEARKKYIVRTDRAGLFFGEIEKVEGNEVEMKNVRKLWYWDGACAVEQIAKDGVKKPEKCQFTVTVKEMTVFNPVQIIECTENAVSSINGVKEWKK